MTFDHESLALLSEALKILDRGFETLPPLCPDRDLGPLRAALVAAARRLRDNYPYQHPLYVGQMLKPPHPVARLAYALALYLNPNNHALDGGRASSRMEHEAVAEIAAMYGWERHLGHLTSGGTVANLEALWVARELTGGRAVAASSQAHYTHSRLSGVLGVPFKAIDVDARGRMSLTAARQALAGGDVGTLVVTLGATATGALDPLADLLPMAREAGVRVHVDAAYGGYFTLAGNLCSAGRRHFDALAEVDSVVVDPHKHGLQPYGCGCVLFSDPAVGRVYRHDSPYTYFTGDELHLGEISLECSRAGASAVALWATQQALPYTPGGDFARDLAACRDAALAWYRRLGADRRFAPLFAPELDIVVWAAVAERASHASARAREIFEAAAREDLHLALSTMPRALVEPVLPGLVWDDEGVLCLRACLIKPTHGEWLDAIWQRLDAAARATARR